MGLAASCRHNFGHLAHFSGRDNRALFWPYAGFVFILSYAGSFLAILPIIASMVPDIEQYAREHPENVTVQSGPGSYSFEIQGFPPELMPDFSLLIWPMALLTSLIILLLAAAVARRLHDRGRSGWWGALPIPFVLGGFVLMNVVWQSFRDIPPDMTVFSLLLINNLVYLLTLLWLIVQLASAGTPGDNAYGTDPLAA